MAQFTRSTARAAAAHRENVGKNSPTSIKGVAHDKLHKAKTRATHDFRVVMQALLQKNIKNITRWLDEVGDGCDKKGIPPDPAKALDLIAKLAEYAVPKLQRTEIMPGDTLRGPPVTQIAITFVDGRAPSAPPLALSSDPGTANVVLDAIPAKTEPAKGVRRRAVSLRSKLIEQ